MNIKIVKAKFADIKKIYNLKKQCYTPIVKDFQSTDIDASKETLFKDVKRFCKRHRTLYKIYLDDQLIGGMRVDDEKPMIMSVLCIFVLPQYQIDGYAMAALECAEKKYTKARVWRLFVEERVLPNTRIYEGCGEVKKEVSMELINRFNNNFYALKGQRAGEGIDSQS